MLRDNRRRFTKVIHSALVLALLAWDLAAAIPARGQEFNPFLANPYGFGASPAPYAGSGGQAPVPFNPSLAPPPSQYSPYSSSRPQDPQSSFSYAPRQLSGGGAAGCASTDGFRGVQIATAPPMVAPVPRSQPAPGAVTTVRRSILGSPTATSQPASQSAQPQPTETRPQPSARPQGEGEEPLSRIEAWFNLAPLPQGAAQSPRAEMAAAPPPSGRLSAAQSVLVAMAQEQAGQDPSSLAQAAAAAQDRPMQFLGPFGAPLRQYGYTMFAGSVSTFAPVDDIPVGPDYVLGPGDDLSINMWGPIETTIVRTVDRNGRVLLPKIGDLRVWGLTFSEADRLVREQLARYFRGFQASVTMGRLRTIRVHVVGEVCQPGVYTLSALSTMTNALFSAGGPSKLGSLREVRLLRNHHAVGTIDLYDFLLRGDRTHDYRLESGDTIFIPTVGEVTAVAGEVKRPAVYEIKGEMRMADLVTMAGGVTPSAYLRRVQVVRSQPGAERQTIDVDLSRFYVKGDLDANPIVRSGDLVLVHPSDQRVYNLVQLAGAVKYPGAYELKPVMRVSQLLPADSLRPEGHADRVEIARRRPDYSVEILRVDLRKAWSGDTSQDVLLRPLDEVTVRSEVRETRAITLSGQVVRPGKYVVAEGERLSSVLERAGGFTDKAYLRGAVFTRASLRKIEEERLREFVKTEEQRVLQSASAVVVGVDKDEAFAAGSTVQARRDLLLALASRVAVGRMVIQLDQPEKLQGRDNDVVLMDGDTLDVPEPPSSVLVIGAVRNSTSVLHQPGANVDYYVNRVGGFAGEANRKGMHLVKADGSAASSFSKVRDVEPGDTIVVPPKEEEKIRLLPTFRDMFQILGSTLLTITTLSVLF